MWFTSSRLNSTPPMGAPNATLTPAAEAADNTCTHTYTMLTIFEPAFPTINFLCKCAYQSL